MKEKLKLVNSVDVEAKLNLGRPLNIKLGFDPTSPNLHLGHYISLKGAKALQDEGHNIIIIIGDYTAKIGDPTGRSATRPALTNEQIEKNAQTYMEQVFLILDPKLTTIKRNTAWLDKVDLSEMIKLLSKVSVAQIMNREDFANRYEKQIPIYLHELVYPLLQGMDSVEIKADIELGGSDQTFNLMMGRELQKAQGQVPQAVATFPLLVGVDGVRKMSKSYGNEIALLDTPTDKFGKIMSLSDEAMWIYWDILDLEKSEKLESLKKDCQEEKINPMTIKMELAKKVVTIFHGEEVGILEQEKFRNKFSKKEMIPEEVLEVKVTEPVMLSKLLRDTGLVTSNNEAIRLIQQRGIKIDGKVVEANYKLEPNCQFVLQVGKIKTKKINLSI